MLHLEQESEVINSSPFSLARPIPANLLECQIAGPLQVLGLRQKHVLQVKPIVPSESIHLSVVRRTCSRETGIRQSVQHRIVACCQGESSPDSTSFTSLPCLDCRYPIFRSQGSNTSICSEQEESMDCERKDKQN